MRHVSAVVLFAATAAQAAPPSVLSYTGTLASESGTAVEDGSYSITASFFAAETGGADLWSETVSVATKDGVFTALFGDAAAFDETALDQADLWLELEVNGDTLTPRLRVASVPYALQAGSATLADDLSCDGCVSAQHIDNTQVQARVTGTPCSPGTAVTAIAPDGAVTCAPAMALAGSGTAPTAARSDHDHTAAYLPRGTVVSCADPTNEKVVAIDALTGDVTCQADFDTDTLYTEGLGISILGTTVSVAFADTQCTGTDKLVGFAAGVPVCAPDVDTDTDTDTDTQHTLTQIPRANSLITSDSSSAGKHVSITIGTDGLPVISYRNGGANADLRVLKCTSADCSTGTPYNPDGAGDVGDYTSIAIGTDGFPVVSYYDVTNTGLKLAKCGDAACSVSSAVVVDTGGANDVGKQNALAIGTDGFPVISYRDATALTLKVVHCDDDACLPGGNTITVAAGPDVGEDTSIAIAVDGLPIISYRDKNTDDLALYRCGNVSCSTGSAVTVDAVGNVGHATSLTIGVDGFPIISYYNATSFDLQVAKCADVDCTAAATISSVDAGGDVGSPSSITIGADGLPVISYHDVTTGSLRVVRCGDASCTPGTNALTTLDPGPIVGNYNSITIGADGLPVVAYRDETNGTLKVAKCANALCLPNWSRR